MKSLTTNKSNIIASFRTRLTKGTAPEFNHPEVGDVMGIGEFVVTITNENQKEYRASYELIDDEIILLTGGMENKIFLTKLKEDEEGWLLDVVNAELSDGILTVTIQESIDVEDDDQAVELFEKEIKDYELHCLEFKDTNTNEVYYMEVESIQTEEWEFDIIA